MVSFFVTIFVNRLFITTHFALQKYKTRYRFMTTEKEISYQHTNSYSTLNKLSDKTKTIWFVCHGMGYLSRYFLKYFKELPPDENYIVAPQAVSKYYHGKDFKHVGASWLTKENTIAETKNVLNYLKAVFDAEVDTKNYKVIILGYSQGVSVASRFVAHYKVQCDQLILHSGGLPKELEPNHFSFLKAKVSMICGDKDQHITEERLDYEIKSAKSLFGNNVNIITFDGVHEVNTEIIGDLVS